MKNIIHTMHCFDINGDLLFMYVENDKEWSEWYDAKRNRVEAIDTTRPESMKNITEEEDAAIEEQINARLKEIAMKANFPAVIYDSMGHYMGFDANEEEAEKMKDIVLQEFYNDYFNKNKKGGNGK